MTDLRNLMHEAAGLSHDPTPSVADADLARARRAMRRRRAGRFGVGSTLVAAATVGAFAIFAPTASPTDPPGEPGSTVAAPAQSGSAIELVSYSGKQPTGYVLDMVPAGWQIRDDTRGLLTLAPKGAEQGDVVQGMTSLEGTIAVSTQSDTGVPSGIKLDRVQVGDRSGVIAHMRGAGDTRTLFVEQGSGTFLVIQVWDGLGWGNQQIVDFAESVHITEDAVPAVG